MSANWKRSVGIVGKSAYLPQREITNFDLGKLVDTSDEWIYTKTGIRKRRIVDDSEGTSDLAAEAANAALKDAEIDPKDVDLIIVATSSPDSIQPSTKKG